MGKINGVKKAAYWGYKELIESDSALNAVEKAVNVMELDEFFNAGFGSVLTCNGKKLKIFKVKLKKKDE